MRQGWKRWWRPVAWAGATILLLAALAWGVLLFEILPRIGQWREDLSQQASRALGVPVEIGRVTGHAEGGWPVLVLDEVRLLDDRRQVALRLPQVTAQVSLASFSPLALWNQEWRLDRLALQGPELDVRRDRQGVIRVAGLRLDMASKPGRGDSVADWVLSQSSIRINQGQIRWTDEWRDQPTIALSDVNLTLRNRPGLGRHWHELTLEATPPKEFGRRGIIKFSMTQPLWQVGDVLIPEGASVPWWRKLVGVAPRPSQWASWSGTVNLDLPWVDVQQLRRYVTLPIEVNGGRGRLAGELSIYKGDLQGVGLDADVRDVSVRLAKDLVPLAFKSLTGRVSVTHEASVTSVSYQKLRFETAEGVVWPASSASLEWRHAPWTLSQFDESVWKLTQGGVFKAERLDLALLAQLADRLPLSGKLRTVLADLAPKGVGSDLEWKWEGPLDAPRTYRTQGRFAGLSWAGSKEPGWPGLAQAKVRFSADEGGGRAELDVDQGWVEFPEVFEEPRIPLSSMHSVVNWQIHPASNPAQQPDVDLFVKQTEFANPDAQGELEAHWHTGGRPDAPDVPRLPGVLDLKGRLLKAQANRVWRYLPLALPASARYYVRDAIKAGQGEKVNFLVNGDLNRFPFKDDVGGRFRVDVPVRQVTLDYVPGDHPAGHPYWPAFSELDGDLIFEGQRMRIEGAKARLGSTGTGAFGLQQVSGVIDDLGGHDPHLVIQGQGQGPLDDALKYLSASPIGQWTGHVLSAATGAGSAGLQLALDIPLDDADKTTLKGKVTLKDSDRAALRLSPSVPAFDSLVGDIGFTEANLAVKARTKVWGQDVVVEGQRDSTGAPRFVAKGVMTAEGLRQAREWPILAKLATRMTGQSPFTVLVSTPKATSIDAPPGVPVVEVSSSLRGLATTLPSPLNKEADSVWPLKVTYRLDDLRGQTDAVIVDIANPQFAGRAEGAPWFKLDMRRDVTGLDAKVIRGSISLMQWSGGGVVAAPAMPAKGVSLQVTVPTLDLDAWRTLGQSVSDDDATAGASVDPVGGYMPDTVLVKAGSVVYDQRTLKDVSATLAHPSAGVWRAQLDAEQVAGQIEWLPDTSAVVQAAAHGAGRVVARLSRLSVPASDAQALEERATAQMLSPDASNTNVPALDIVVDDFEWRGLSLGRLEVEAVNKMVGLTVAGASPEWRLTKLKLGAPEAQLSATGTWSAPNSPTLLRSLGLAARSRPRSSFDFTLDLHNLGDTLTRLGLPKTIRGGKGKVTGQVSWQGSPLHPDTATMTGDLNVLVNQGQFLKADPGIAKLLGVLSLQSLPRRLTLDFRDVFQQGFAFDSIDGQVKIDQGVAETRNLRMRGVQAVALMEGQADLIKETQNLHVYVVPDLNAVGASLAVAAINPVVGLGAFLAQVLLRKQVAEVGAQEFLITGPWADPQVEKVLKPALPASAASE